MRETVTERSRNTWPQINEPGIEEEEEEYKET